MPIAESAPGPTGARPPLASRDLYKMERRLEGFFRIIPRQVSTSHVALLKEWQNRLRTRGGNGSGPCGPAATLKHLNSARNLLRWMEREDMGDFRDLTPVKIEALFAIVQKKVPNPETKKAHLLALKLLYRHVKGLNEDPPETKWIRIDAGIVKNRLPEDILTPEEFSRLIYRAEHPMYEALLGVLGVGLRIGETLGLQLRHVQADDFGVVLIVHGKGNKMRRVRAVETAGHIVKWLESHPEKGNGEAPLFVNIGNTNRGAPFGYHAAHAALRRIAERTGVDAAKVKPHALRHFAATRDAARLPEPILRTQFGWSATSRTPARYVHLAGSAVDEAVLKAAGVETAVKREPVSLCPKCRFPVDAKAARFCGRCSSPLSLQAAVEAEKRTEEAKDFATVLGEEILRLSDANPEFGRILGTALQKRMAAEKKQERR